MAANGKKERPVESDQTGQAPAKPRRGNDSHIGQALRSVWDEALSEQVPGDMLDLLGKLN
ncbi:NepR family anti-sigma factor [Edaphosphingomonas fennica]|uniref:NepR family anti-sigma factor n=1 Tax=Sphingomonadales TaxID=204457 RepID=UPI0005A48483